MKNKMMRLVVLGLLGFCFGGVIAYFETRTDTSAEPSLQPDKEIASVIKPISSVGGAFELVSETGDTVTEATWPGKHKLVFFGFTHCPDVCPAGLEKMASALENVPNLRQNIIPLFITVDPVRDTPEVMLEYTDLFDSEIIGLTGNQDQIDHVVDAYKVYAAKDAADESIPYQMQHSAYIYLMNPQNELLKVIGSETSVSEIVDVLKAVF